MKRASNNLRPLTAFLLVGCGCAAAIVATAGCEQKKLSPLPEVFPVNGTVSTVSGVRLSGGAVEFQSVGKIQSMGLAKINPEGSFEVDTPLRDGRNIQGLRAGDYQVTVHGNSGEQGELVSQTLPEVYTVEEKDNRFELTVKDAKW